MYKKVINRGEVYPT